MDDDEPPQPSPEGPAGTSDDRISKSAWDLEEELFTAKIEKFSDEGATSRTPRRVIFVAFVAFAFVAIVAKVSGAGPFGSGDTTGLNLSKFESKNGNAAGMYIVSDNERAQSSGSGLSSGLI